MFTRRSFLSTAAAAPLAAQKKPAAKPKIALVITEYRRNSHADVIGTRLLGGYDYYGKRQEPRVQVAAMFTDQVPMNDMSRDMAKKYNVPVFDTVAEALKAGSGSLAVDGVVLIGEHGRYPYNEKGQHLYPRYELFQQIVEVFRSTGKSVPVFCDKHLSVEWKKAKWMVDQSKELKFPFLAGSSVPVAWRRPEIEPALGSPIKHAVAAAYGGMEAYGFHAFEMMQCLVERRKGGETGIAAVQCFEGADVWKWTDANAWAPPLLEAAVARSGTRKSGAMRDNAKHPELFVIEYKDGCRGAVFMLDGHISDFNVAVDTEGAKAPLSSLFFLQPERPYAHFAGLTHWIEEMMVTGKAPYPVERTLLVTGALAALMDSAWRGHVRLETPYLDVAYTAAKGSFYNRGAVPPGKETI
ncbi:MAG: hypothetical protein U0Q16_15105 [Bryobacteraceae bacterium]